MALELNEKNKKLIVIAGGLALLLFANTNFYMPAFKKIMQLRGNLKSITSNNKRIKESAELLSKSYNIEGRLKEADEFYQKYLPQDKSVARLITLLSEGAEKFNIQVVSISPKNPRLEKMNMPDSSLGYIEYFILPVDISIIASVGDFVNFFNWSRSLQKLISLDTLEISQDKQVSNKLNIRMGLVSYALVKLPEVSDDILTYKVFKPKDIDRLLDVLSLFKSEELSQSDFILFNMSASSDSEKRGDLSGELSLSGIIFGTERKVAVINGQSYREGDVVSGKKIVEINKKSVILEYNYEKYILELGEK